jgi:hypothetical protein
MKICDEEGDVESLHPGSQSEVPHGSTVKDQLTGIGFRLKIMKLSARPVMKRVNLWHKIFSISSACLIAMLTRTELMDGSTITRSLSFREIVSGVSKTSLVVLSW